MANSLISIQEAAELSGKSIQTIRRAVKAKKVAFKKKRTPQGFNYLINRESLIQVYNLRIETEERKKGSIKKKSKNTDVAKEFASTDDIKKVQKDIENLLSEHEKAKQSFMRFMKTFQDRFIVMENQLKLLEEPTNKKWFEFWK